MSNEHNCPVCDKHTFSCHDSFEVCPICGWEDDELQCDEPDYEGGANTESLNQAKDEWNKHQKTA